MLEMKRILVTLRENDNNLTGFVANLGFFFDTQGFYRLCNSEIVTSRDKERIQICCNIIICMCWCMSTCSFKGKGSMPNVSMVQTAQAAQTIRSLCVNRAWSQYSWSGLSVP